MSGPRQGIDAAPIDRTALAGISRGDAATERRLLAIFRKAHSADADALRGALEQRDVVAVTRAAHRVMGASRMAGALALADICGSLAQAGAAGDWDIIAANRDALNRELERIEVYLNAQFGRE